ncbi:MAG TPA: FtsX-like permease family protein [Candidatus Babeliales bacterium]|nr:FtsX-like permease family protein [Candidatus Babeliales bacterium]
MKQFIQLLSLRYLREATEQHTLGSMVKICFFSIALATGSLALIGSIMRGFEQAAHNTLQSIHSDIIIEPHGFPLDERFIEKTLNNYSQIIGYSPSKSGHAMISAINDNNVPQAIIIKGVSPAQEANTSCIEQMIIAPKTKKTLKTLLNEPSIIIGSKLAEMLNVTCGHTVKLFYATDYQSIGKKIHLDTQTVKIAGIFKTGIDEFDSSMALSSLEFFDQLFDQEIDSIAIRLQKKTDTTSVIQSLKRELPYLVLSWKDLYPALFSALKLERFAMMAILLLIIIISSMTIVALMFMLITHKKSDIVILRAMGGSVHQIRILFLAIGTCITLPATIAGLIGAFLIGFICKHCIHLELPDTYYATNLPIDLNPILFIAIGFSVFTISLIASWLPLSSLNRLRLSSHLR